MRMLPVEPSCLLFGASASNPETKADFEQRFWPQFNALRKGWMLNERKFRLRIPWTADLQLAACSTFPFYAGAGRWNPSGFEAHSEMIRFLADRTEIVEFAAEGGAWGDRLCRTGVYDDDGVWLAWCDLLDQIVAADGQTGPVDALASSEPWSCFREALTGCENGTVLAKRVGRGEWPHGFLDPAAWDAIVCRRGEAFAPIPIVYEKTGHQPPRTIRKVLERTLRPDAVRQVVLRAGTTWSNAALPETCKVWREDSLHEIQFRLSDGTCTYKGVFTTIAATMHEAEIALEVVRDAFIEVCNDEGLEVVSEFSK